MADRYVAAAPAVTLGALVAARETSGRDLEEAAKPEEREVVEDPDALASARRP